MGQKKTDLNEYRRFIGYLLLTFTSIFIYIPVLWLINLWGTNGGLYTRWAVASAFLVIFNLGFYYVRIPQRWLQNLSIALAVDVLILLAEYFWLFYSI